MNKNQKVIAVLLLLVFVVISLLLIRVLIYKPTITSYQGTDSSFYKCSKPLAAKKATIPHLGSESEGLVPVSQEDAKKYCHMTGVE